MGIVHFAPVGTRPGAVTSALAYLKHNQNKFTGFKGPIIESIIIFTSPDIRDGSIPVKECFNNEYGSLLRPGSPWQNLSVLNVIKKFVEKELNDIIPAKGFLSVCIVNHNDYDDCFEKIAKTVLKLSPGHKVGKNIWANLTGGTNILNSALLEVALLSGRISRLYYTFLSDVKTYGHYLQPPSKDRTIFEWREIPFVKTNFDSNYYEVLKVLAEVSDWCEDLECLNRLKNKGIESFINIDIQTFRRIYLNLMDGREIERNGNKNRLSKYGKKVLDRIRGPLFKALIYREESINEELKNLTKDFKLEELWCNQ
jgi:hypothetical protein